MAKETKEQQSKGGGAYVVVKPFRDISDFSKEYAAGDDVSNLAPERLQHLVQIGHVEQK